MILDGIKRDKSLCSISYAPDSMIWESSELMIRSKGVHGSVWVEFSQNHDPTHTWYTGFSKVK